MARNITSAMNDLSTALTDERKARAALREHAANAHLAATSIQIKRKKTKNSLERGAFEHASHLDLEPPLYTTLNQQRVDRIHSWGVFHARNLGSCTGEECEHVHSLVCS